LWQHPFTCMQALLAAQPALCQLLAALPQSAAVLHAMHGCVSCRQRKGTRCRATLMETTLSAAGAHCNLQLLLMYACAPCRVHRVRVAAEDDRAAGGCAAAAQPQLDVRCVPPSKGAFHADKARLRTLAEPVHVLELNAVVWVLRVRYPHVRKQQWRRMRHHLATCGVLIAF